jgi:rhodanese-related sulfurtransferase
MDYSPAAVRSISVDELQERLKNSAPFLLDVREVEEMADGTIDGSVNIPMGQVEQRLDEIPTDREIVVICHLGARSGYITKRLNALGYERAMNLRGGMEAWLAESSRAND